MNQEEEGIGYKNNNNNNRNDNEDDDDVASMVMNSTTTTEDVQFETNLQQPDEQVPTPPFEEPPPSYYNCTTYEEEEQEQNQQEYQQQQQRTNTKKRPFHNGSSSNHYDDMNLIQQQQQKEEQYDHNNEKDEADDEDDNNNDEEKVLVGQYERMLSFGEHSRAISSVQFAPSRLCKNVSGSGSYNSNSNNSSSDTSSSSSLLYALAASASSDGICQVWDLRSAYEYEQQQYQQHQHHHPNTPLTSSTIQREPDDDDHFHPSTTTSTTGTTPSDSRIPHHPTSHRINKKNRQRNVMKPVTVCQNSTGTGGGASSNITSSSGSGGGHGNGHSRGINDVCWNPISPLLATASDDKTIRLWDAVTGDSLVELRGHDNFVFCVDMGSKQPPSNGTTTNSCCTSTNNLLVSGSFDETVKLWDIRTGQCVCTIPAHSDPVTAVSLNRDGTTIASSSHDGLIRIWDIVTGECLKTLYAAGNPPVSNVKFAPNGRYLLAGTLDSTIRLWPVTLAGTNRCTKTYREPIHLPQYDNVFKLLQNTSTNNNTNNHTTIKKKQANKNVPNLVQDTVVRTTKSSKVLNKQSQQLQQQQVPIYPRYHVNTKYCISSDFTYDGNIITGSETGHILIYDLQDRSIRQIMKHHMNPKSHHHHNNHNSASNVPSSKVSLFPQDITSGSSSNGHHSSTKSSNKSSGKRMNHSITMNDTPTTSTNLQQEPDIVLAVSAHDSMPLLCSGSMTNAKTVEFWMMKK